MNEGMSEIRNGWMNKGMNKWRNERMREWINEWMNSESMNNDCCIHYSSLIVYEWVLCMSGRFVQLHQKGLWKKPLWSLSYFKDLCLSDTLFLKDLIFVHKKVFHMKDLFMSFISYKFRWPGWLDMWSSCHCWSFINLWRRSELVHSSLYMIHPF